MSDVSQWVFLRTGSDPNLAVESVCVLRGSPSNGSASAKVLPLVIASSDPNQVVGLTYQQGLCFLARQFGFHRITSSNVSAEIPYGAGLLGSLTHIKNVAVDTTSRPKLWVASTLAITNPNPNTGGAFNAYVQGFDISTGQQLVQITVNDILELVSMDYVELTSGKYVVLVIRLNDAFVPAGFVSVAVFVFSADTGVQVSSSVFPATVVINPEVDAGVVGVGNSLYYIYNQFDHTSGSVETTYLTTTDLSTGNTSFVIQVDPSINYEGMYADLNRKVIYFSRFSGAIGQLYRYDTTNGAFNPNYLGLVAGNFGGEGVTYASTGYGQNRLITNDFLITVNGNSPYLRLFLSTLQVYDTCDPTFDWLGGNPVADTVFAYAPDLGGGRQPRIFIST